MTPVDLQPGQDIRQKVQFSPAVEPAEALKEHRALLRAIEARDSDRAERIAREHRRKTLDLRREMLRSQLRKSRADADASREGE